MTLIFEALKRPLESKELNMIHRLQSLLTQIMHLNTDTTPHVNAMCPIAALKFGYD